MEIEIPSTFIRMLKRGYKLAQSSIFWTNMGTSLHINKKYEIPSMLFTLIFFQISNPIDLESCLSRLSTSITNDMNSQLFCEYTKLKVKEALFQTLLALQIQMAFLLIFTKFLRDKRARMYVPLCWIFFNNKVSIRIVLPLYQKWCLILGQSTCITCSIRSQQKILQIN